MWCKKCGGRVFIDRMYVGAKKKKKGDTQASHEEATNVELFCVMCGKRWMLNKEKNVVAKWLSELEKVRNGAFATSTSK